MDSPFPQKRLFIDSTTKMEMSFIPHNRYYIFTNIGKITIFQLLIVGEHITHINFTQLRYITVKTNLSFLL